VGNRVIVIGLDAAEATLLERWAAEGDLPAFASLTARGAVARLGNQMETLPGAIWPELMTGRSAGAVPLYYHPWQLHTGEAETREITEEDLDPSDCFWAVASDAGCRVAVVDVPQAPLVPGLNGIQLLEWGNHDRTFATRSDPPELLEEVRARWGDHPVESCDNFGETLERRNDLREALASGVTHKTELLLDVLARDDWDLLVGTYTETHCAGHQFWHFLDPASASHIPDAPPELRDTILDTYRLVDAGLGALLDAAGPDTTVLVVASHGMGRYLGGPQLLPELLVRLDMVKGARARRRIPPVLRAALRHRLPGVAKQIARVSGLHAATTRAVTLCNNRCGAIRLNLAGREPVGRVQPGAEADELLAELTREMLALRQPATGEPIVKQVLRAEEAYGPDHHPDVPDLLVAFRTDLGPLDECESPRVGRIEVPVKKPWATRTGDHTVESRLWIVGPGVEPGSRIEGGNVLDLAPTVTALLGVDLPERFDGRPLLARNLA
jgi:predicted AlkP superfamily phosphohydrolase/phosphomutase